MGTWSTWYPSGSTGPSDGRHRSGSWRIRPPGAVPPATSPRPTSSYRWTPRPRAPKLPPRSRSATASNPLPDPRLGVRSGVEEADDLLLDLGRGSALADRQP